MQPPEFWYGDAQGRDRAPALQALLRPLSWLYEAGGAWRVARAKPHRAGAPVICIGNLTLGGTGKTPVARTVRAWLRDRGVAAHLLSRGYGGKLEGPVRVDPALHTADDVGDEPLLHALEGPAWIARDRAKGADAAVAAGAEIVVLDDGFQNPRLHKDLSLLVFDGEVGVGNGRVFPAGPLREPLRLGFKRADALVLMQAEGAPAWLPADAPPSLHARLTPVAETPRGPLLAFAGIGRPERFFAMLRAMGAEIRTEIGFPDHHPYDQIDLQRLAEQAEALSARLITTEKDLVRLPPPWRARVLALPVTARFADDAALERLLAPLATRAMA
jgi:tetraacyldisaccharide 4'-kinase